MSKGALTWFSKIGLAFVVSCGGGDREPVAAGGLPMSVQFAGCAQVRRGPVCALRPDAPTRLLRLFVETSPEARLSVFVDGRVVETTRREAGLATGTALDVPVPRGGRRLEIVAQTESARGSFVLGLAEPAVCAQVDRIASMRRQGKLVAALDSSRELVSSSADVCRTRALGLEARLLLDLDRPREAVRAFQTAIAQGRSGDDLSQWPDDAFALAYTLITKLRDFDAARALLDELEPVAKDFHEASGYLTYYRSLIALEVGDLRVAMSELERSFDAATRLGMTRLRVGVAQTRAELLALLGRTEEASRLLVELSAPEGGLSECDRADCLNTVGWVMLRAGFGSRKGELDPGSALEQALSLYRDACPRPAMEANTLVNLALLELARSNVASAKTWLEQAQAKREAWDDFVASWMLDLRGRVELAEGRPRSAFEIYSEMQRGAPRLSEASLRASLGQARALEGLRKPQEAAEQYLRAEDILDEQLRLVPLSEGRTGFVEDREIGAKRLVELRLEQGRTKDAFIAARRAIGRVAAAAAGLQRIGALSGEDRSVWERHISEYRSLRARLSELEARARSAARDELVDIENSMAQTEAQARAQLDKAYAVLGDRPKYEQDPVLEAGEAFLLYCPLLNHRLAAFLWREGRLVGRTLTMPGPASAPVAFSDSLLEPFRASLRGVRSLRIVAAGPVSAVDFHALPWNGAPLIESFAVAYSLDLPARKSKKAEQHAAVIADPTSTLASAPAEAEYVAERLRGVVGTDNVQRFSDTQIDRAAFVDILGRVEVLHFAGHGVHRGVEGFASALSLAKGELFEVGDALSLPAPPRVIVLSACEAGAAFDTGSAAQGLGLAQAFVLAGSDAVIASTRRLDDREAFELVKSLYKSPEVYIQTAHALRSAQNEVRESCAACDWSAFRVLVP